MTDILALGKLSPKRALFLQKALECMGAPYIWGAKGKQVDDDGRTVRAFDCSGLVTVALKAAGGLDFMATHNTDKMWDEFEPTGAPAQGDLCLYGAQGDPNHVTIWLGGGLILGANGGGRNTTTVEVARATKAKVRTNFPHTYRPDFLGFRSLAEFLD